MWWPTWAGWLCVFGVAGILAAIWALEGESFLARTERQPADVLIVEGWISGQGISAAADEFKIGGYRAVVATGGWSGERWSARRWNYALDVEGYFLRMGLSRDRVILASSQDTEAERTFQMAVAAWRALHAAGPMPRAVNIFTRGAHARRSRLVFAKAFGPATKVGVISWQPTNFEMEHWWHSSERSEDLIKETVGYLFELIFNSGRASNSPQTGG